MVAGIGKIGSVGVAIGSGSKALSPSDLLRETVARKRGQHLGIYTKLNNRLNLQTETLYFYTAHVR